MFNTIHNNTWNLSIYLFGYFLHMNLSLCPSHYYYSVHLSVYLPFSFTCPCLSAELLTRMVYICNCIGLTMNVKTVIITFHLSRKKKTDGKHYLLLWSTVLTVPIVLKWIASKLTAVNIYCKDNFRSGSSSQKISAPPAPARQHCFNQCWNKRREQHSEFLLYLYLSLFCKCV